MPGPCLLQQQLIEAVRVHLLKISELSNAAAGAIADRNEALSKQLDLQIESEIGAKERAMGALREHRAEHGC